LTTDFYGLEIWFLTSKEEHRQRVFKNRVLGKIPGPKRGEVMVDWGKNCIVRSFMICAAHQILLE
jgi:hypothetical protein